MVAERDGRLDEVEDELFRFGRAVSGSGELSVALTDPALPVASKVALVTDLLGPAQPETTALVAHVVAAPRGRTVELRGRRPRRAGRRASAARLGRRSPARSPLTEAQRDPARRRPGTRLRSRGRPAAPWSTRRWSAASR